MHDGSLLSLKEVMRFYNQGGVPNEVLSPLIKPLGLSEEEMDDVIAFLNSLTSGNIGTLVADAFAAPIGDLGHDDPNWVHESDVK
jgi:cytochrome c peroxidase